MEWSFIIALLIGALVGYGFYRFYAIDLAKYLLGELKHVDVTQKFKKEYGIDTDLPNEIDKLEDELHEYTSTEEDLEKSFKDKERMEKIFKILVQLVDKIIGLRDSAIYDKLPPDLAKMVEEKYNIYKHNLEILAVANYTLATGGELSKVKLVSAGDVDLDKIKKESELW